MKIRIKLTEEMLGTKAANPNVFADFIASKHPSGTPQRDELDKAESREESGTTVFHRLNGLDGSPGLWDYQIKGFLKDAIAALNRMDKDVRNDLAQSKDLEKLSAFKTKIDQCIFVEPRFIPIQLPDGAKVGMCERPLRAQTAQGERVSVCRSETVPPGSTIEVDITIMAKELVPYVIGALNYGKLRGIGCWRNSGKGRFTYITID